MLVTQSGKLEAGLVVVGVVGVVTTAKKEEFGDQNVTRNVAITPVDVLYSWDCFATKDDQECLGLDPSMLAGEGDARLM